MLQQRALREAIGKRAASFAREHFSIATLRQNLVSVMTEVQRSRIDETKPAYQPSCFAKDYEAHKRACGWYASGEEGAWYPPMFQGEAYTLYETLMQFYVTNVAQEMHQQEIEAEWIPYYPSIVKIDPCRLLLSDEDPIWPHRLFFTSSEWEVIRRIDGHHTVAAIVYEQHEGNLDSCTALLWKLYLESFILFADDNVALCLSSIFV